MPALPLEPKRKKHSNPFNDRLKQRQAVVYAAMWGYYNAAQIHYVSERTNSAYLGQRLLDTKPPPNFPNYTDCSGFARWCYLSAGFPDIGGWTGPQWDKGKAITLAALVPGDLVFYGSPRTPGAASHVSVYVGRSKLVSHGGDEGPSLRNMSDRSDIAGFRTYFY